MTKISDITAAVESALKELSVCGIESEVVDKPTFKCYPDSPSYVTIRGHLIGTTTEDSASLLLSMREWVSTRPQIPVNSVLLRIDSTCSVSISSLTEEECLEVDSTSNATSSTDNAPLLYGATVAGSVSLMVFLAILVVCIVVLWRKQRNKYRLRKAWFV